LSHRLPLVTRAAGFGDRPALTDAEGTHRYDELLERSGGVAHGLLDGRRDLAESRVCFLTGRNAAHAVVQWGIWRAGGVAVPLAESHPAGELAHVLDDARPESVVAETAHLPRIQVLTAERGLRLVAVDAGGRPATASGPHALPSVDPDRRALMIYTSGTTGRPKGAVWTHANLVAQLEALAEAWGWSEGDRILLVLPLHHVHGMINVLESALWNGARCDMAPAFQARDVWERFASDHLTLFMAVPTIYARLIAEWEAADEATRTRWSQGAARLRLMVSGSAALPVRVLDRWRELTGHTLLERYGMSEIGMALTNPLRGDRVPGHVGRPFPGVEIRRVDSDGRVLTEDSEPGEMEVRGPGVFLEYWERPDETREAFRDGWFRTGDVAVIEGGHYRLLGRSSVDILKTGGYKVSALEIEEALREHPEVADCAVVGVADEEWGQRVAAAVVRAGQADADDLVPRLEDHLQERLAPYKRPRSWRVLDELPRNAMGKVTKPAVSALFLGDDR